MPAAAHAAAVSFSSDDTTYVEVDGINDASLQRLVDLLDTTDFKDTSGAHTRIAGLKDTSVSLSGDWEPADTGWLKAETAYSSGATLYVKVLLNGTNGYKAPFKVESIELSGGVDGKCEVSISCQGTGAATILP